MGDTYILTSHVKFLEAAGARIQPINYRQSTFNLQKQLSKLNGIYIPGDSYHILKNDLYM